MKMKYKLCFTVACILIFFSMGFSIVKQHKKQTLNESFSQLNNEIINDNICDFKINDDYTIDGDFSSHLPIVVIDLEGNTIPYDYKYNSESESFELASDIDPYSTGIMTVIDNEDKINSITDIGALSSKIKIRYRGNSSIRYAKKQFGIKLLNEQEEESELSMLGMESDEDWILNISMADKSLIRNYLAFNIAGEIMEYTPDVKYCEVVFKNGDVYEYQGLYLMMESIKKSEGRVNISPYEEGKSYTSYILRRDRFKDDGIMLNTEAALNNTCYGWLEVRYPNEKYVDENLYNYILDDVNNIEQIIYSENNEIFNTYNQFIDEDSFIDYFIVNEFFMNYDAGNNSTYMYKDIGSKIKMGPVWDFDQSIDNYDKGIADLKQMVFIDRPWFEKLINSHEFNKKLLKRYKELRKNILSDENIDNKISDIVAYIGDAQKRDYFRWGKYYSNLNSELVTDSYGITIDRSGNTFEEEIMKVNDTLKIHGKYMTQNIKNLVANSKFNNIKKVYGGFSILFLILFLCSVVIVRRKYM